MRAFVTLCIASLAFSGCLGDNKDATQGVLDDVVAPVLGLVVTNHTIEGKVTSAQTPLVAFNGNGLLGEPVTHELTLTGDVQNITMDFTASGAVGAFEARILIAYPDCAMTNQFGYCAEEIEFLTEGLEAHEVLPEPMNGTYTLRVFLHGEQGMVGADDLRFTMDLTSVARMPIGTAGQEAA